MLTQLACADVHTSQVERDVHAYSPKQVLILVTALMTASRPLLFPKEKEKAATAASPHANQLQRQSPTTGAPLAMRLG